MKSVVDVDTTLAGLGPRNWLTVAPAEPGNRSALSSCRALSVRRSVDDSAALRRRILAATLTAGFTRIVAAAYNPAVNG